MAVAQMVYLALAWHFELKGSSRRADAADSEPLTRVAVERLI